jgi:hypothetical protein
VNQVKNGAATIILPKIRYEPDAPQLIRSVANIQKYQVEGDDHTIDPATYPADEAAES